MEFFDLVYYGNSIKSWLISAAVFLTSLFVFKILLRFIRNRIENFAQKTETKIDDLVVLLLDKTSFLILLIISMYLGSLYLDLSEFLTNLLKSIIVLGFLFQIAIWGKTLITILINRYVKMKMESDASAATTVSALGFIAKILLYSALVLIALDNLGFNITTLIAGLGVGGIAIALAVQNILGDLFASLSIVIDKPFVVGDFIIVNEFLGTVEHVGLKTTRIRSLSGEQLIFSNNDLLNSRIRNYKRMNERRVVFSIGVVYQTTKQQLEKIPGYIREFIEEQDSVRFDRAHFKDYGNFSLNFEIVYWINSPDYNTYMDIQQAINLKIFDKFEKEKIEFAYPTQTLFMNQLPKS
jgi:small-conductance mechanosensitive channel